MIPQPITIIEPQIRALNADRLSRLYRPIGRRVERARPGDLLWVREPFFLAGPYDHLSPSQADACGAIPNFVTEFTPEQLRSLSPKRRNARELLRTWHRQHLRITRIKRARLQSITDAEVEAQGFVTGRAGFAATWNANLALAQAGNDWDMNPEVLVLDFERILTSAFAMVPEAIAMNSGGRSSHQFGGMSPWAEGEARDPSPPKRANAPRDLYDNHEEGQANG